MPGILRFDEDAGKTLLSVRRDRMPEKPGLGRPRTTRLPAKAPVFALARRWQSSKSGIEHTVKGVAMSRMNDPNMPQQPEQQQGQSTTEQMQEQLRSAGAKAQQQFENLRHTATEYYEQGKEKAMQWEQGLEDYVREQPVKSLLIAAGVGMLVGMIWRRM